VLLIQNQFSKHGLVTNLDDITVPSHCTTCLHGCCGAERLGLEDSGSLGETDDYGGIRVANGRRVSASIALFRRFLVLLKAIETCKNSMIVRKLTVNIVWRAHQ
jgi:hypothetical protein